MVKKKSTALVFLAVAYLLMLMHNLIPHHHHSSEEELNRHHQSHHHHHDEDAGNNTLGHLLSHFIHPDDGIATKSNRNILNAQLHRQVITFSELPGLAFINKNCCTTVWQIPDSEHFQELLFHFTISGLRAPPIHFI